MHIEFSLLQALMQTYQILQERCIEKYMKYIKENMSEMWDCRALFILDFNISTSLILFICFFCELTSVCPEEKMSVFTQARILWRMIGKEKELFVIGKHNNNTERKMNIVEIWRMSDISVFSVLSFNDRAIRPLFINVQISAARKQRDRWSFEALTYEQRGCFASCWFWHKLIKYVDINDKTL